MVHNVLNKAVFFIMAGIMLAAANRINALSSLARNDGFPLFAAYDRQCYSFVHLKEKLQYKDPRFAEQRHDLINLAIKADMYQLGTPR